MLEYAKSFYKSRQWQEVSRAYMASKGYVCERCGGVASICHHRKYITPANINDPTITLNFDNLECLCATCHQNEHKLKKSKVIFSEDGNIERVKESAALQDYKKAVKAIERLESGVLRTKSVV
jgi:hypothetical protein